MGGQKTVLRGFNRLGILLAVPVVLWALVIAVQQGSEPTGPLRSSMPAGTLAFAPTNPNALQRQLLSTQQAHNVIAPDNFIVLGSPVTRPPNTFHRFIDDGVETPDYTIFQLRDGREIVIGSTDDQRIMDAAYAVLAFETATDTSFPFHTNELAAGVPVRIACDFCGDEMAEWPAAASRRSADFGFSGMLALMALAVYGVCIGLGWVIQGFIPDRSGSETP